MRILDEYYVHYLRITYYFVDDIEVSFEAFAVFMRSISWPSLELYKRSDIAFG